MMPGQQFAYAYDDIGNRRWTRTGGDDAGSSQRLALYTNNLLNQITSREVPGYVEVQGSAHADATVTVNLQPTYRHGEFYRAELAVNNTSALVWQGVTNLAVLQLPGGDMLTTNIGNALVPKTPQVLQYDLDGNLTNDGVWSYVWDASDRPRANRLKNMSGLSALPTAARQALTFRYDYAGRRITKVVSNWTGSAWAGASTNKFLYDGWNLLAELNHTNALLRSYTWGTDASGTMQGAGGVGGLLAMTVHAGTNAGTYFYAYDGNHNVAGLVNAATGGWAARYEYGPFGELLRASGPVALENPFLFSTKYLDWESGLYYYGHRYYDPVAGRWPNRDPIGENGGVNLYGFVANDPTDAFDPLGLDISAPFRQMQACKNLQNTLDTSANNQVKDALAEYIKGGAKKISYGPNDPWTQALQKHSHLDGVRARIREEYKKRCAGSYGKTRDEDNFNLNALSTAQNVQLLLRDLAAPFLGINMANTTGSIRFRWQQANKANDCCCRQVLINFMASDALRLGSNTRIPTTTIEIVPDNFFGKNGPFHNVDLEWNWSEVISY